MLTALIIIIIHTIGDFLFQMREEATNKSELNSALTKHVIKYTLVWLAIGFIITTILGYEFVDLVLFCTITFCFHWITDYFTSKITKKQFIKEQYYTEPLNFGVFTTIQLDQILHYIQLFGTYYLIFT